MKMILPTEKQIENAQKKNIWDFANNILYILCKENFEHKEDKYILTKVLFIGRIYAAAVERRKNKANDINDNFYIKTIAPTFSKSELDNKLHELKDLKTIEIKNIKSVLQTHYYLTNTLLYKITELNKRSFSSKYLHFHLPDLFYIYDSRVVMALKQFKIQVPDDLKPILSLDGIDYEYAKFYCKCYDLKRQIENKYNIELSNRQLDNLLIDVTNKNLEKQ